MIAIQVVRRNDHIQEEDVVAGHALVKKRFFGPWQIEPVNQALEEVIGKQMNLWFALVTTVPVASIKTAVKEGDNGVVEPSLGSQRLEVAPGQGVRHLAPREFQSRQFIISMANTIKTVLDQWSVHRVDRNQEVGDSFLCLL